MIGRFLKARFAAFERQTGESVDYMRDMLSYSPAGLWRFLMFMPLAAHRRALSKDAYHIARMVATQHEDCGPCLQTVVSIAAYDGVNPALLQAVLEQRVEALPADLADVVHFVNAVLTHDIELEQCRQALIAKWGASAMTELALAIASVRVFPTVKRAMGYGMSCARVQIKVPERHG